MLRALCVLIAGCAAVAAFQAPASLQWSGDPCAGREPGSRHQRHCEVRENTVNGPPVLDIDPGRNGGVHVRGWTRSDIRLRARIEGVADTAARAQQIAAGVRVNAVDGRLRADGPTTWDDERWSATFFLDIPTDARLVVNTHNGGVSVEQFRGTVAMRAHNGSLTLRDVGGDIRGRAQNGALRIDLTGGRWEGAGLDVETHNGAVRLMMPAAYSAELETGTVNGRVEIDVPMVIHHPGRARRFTATIGKGGPKIRAVTHNGSVVVRTQ